MAYVGQSFYSDSNNARLGLARCHAASSPPRDWPNRARAGGAKERLNRFISSLPDSLPLVALPFQTSSTVLVQIANMAEGQSHTAQEQDINPWSVEGARDENGEVVAINYEAICRYVLPRH